MATAKLLKARARIAKMEVDELQAKRLADVEQELAAIYHIGDHEVWEATYKAADAAVRDANARIAEVCQSLGIREEFRPGLAGVGWYGRGENAAKERRAELRRVAKRRYMAEAKRAKLVIDTVVVDRQAKLIAGALHSSEAQAFLETMPTPEALLVRLELPELEAGLPTRGTGLLA